MNTNIHETLLNFFCKVLTLKQSTIGYHKKDSKLLTFALFRSLNKFRSEWKKAAVLIFKTLFNIQI